MSLNRDEMMADDDVHLRSAVKTAFRKWLKRDPESESTIAAFVALGSIEAIDQAVSASDEAKISRTIDFTPWFYQYSSVFDAEETIRRHAVAGINSDPDFVTNFIGTKVSEKSYPGILDGRAGTVEPIPIPCNWHADIAEWASVLRAVDLARDTFVVVELGCGPGCWINNAGVAARNAGLLPKLIGVEGDHGHIEFARQACAANGFDPKNVTLFWGIAAAESGFALFPRQETAGQAYGLEPVFEASEEQRRRAAQSGQFDELPMIALDRILEDGIRSDLLHIDIQGGEANFIRNSKKILDKKVAYMFVGTHSRAIEGEIMSVLANSPWRLEVERPAIVVLTSNGPVTHVDGVQGWRNMSLRP